MGAASMTIVYHAADAALANRIQNELGRELNSDDHLILILSPQAVEDSAIQNAIARALDQNKLIVPVLSRVTPLPKMIEHLEAVDFTEGYNLDALVRRLSAPENALHMKVHTPAVQVSNRRVAYVIAAIVLIMFLGGIYLVGVMDIQAPVEEYDTVETEIIQTRDFYIDSVLPRSTEDALNFQATVDAARPTLRPVLIATATAIAAQ
jgi:TIR domain